MEVDEEVVLLCPYGGTLRLGESKVWWETVTGDVYTG